MRRSCLLAPASLAAVAAVSALALAWASGAPGGGREVLFTVQEGWGAARIAGALSDSGLVRSRLYILVRARMLGLSTMFQAGTYRFDSSMEPDSIISLMAQGAVVPEPTHWVTVPEGLRIEETLPLLAQNLDIPLDSLEEAASDDSLLSSLGLASLEGFLFPETYEFADSLPARSILARMVRTGLERRDSTWLGSVEGLGLTGQSAVVLASIVEREARIDTERPMVAGVFLNRLRAGMRLESCATVQYALGAVRERLTYADLRIDSPYNTYLHAGLPPGPICSPGQPSLASVANPDTSGGYMYFVSREDGSGGHLFARTLAGHYANIREVRSGQH